MRSLNQGCPPNLYIRWATLYPAAYPNPGKRDIILVPSGAEAASRKITEESADIENLALLLINRLAIVSTGWKISNSAIPIISNMLSQNFKSYDVRDESHTRTSWSHHTSCIGLLWVQWCYRRHFLRSTGESVVVFLVYAYRWIIYRKWGA